MFHLSATLDRDNVTLSSAVPLAIPGMSVTRAVCVAPLTLTEGEDKCCRYSCRAPEVLDHNICITSPTEMTVVPENGENKVMTLSKVIGVSFCYMAVEVSTAM